jgi:segregation and condensation protein B
MSAPEQPDTDAEPLTDTGEAVVGTDEAVVETGDAVVETDSAVVETADAVVETLDGTEAAEGEEGQSASSVPVVEDEKPRMDLSQLMAIVEALVFASPEPLTPKMLLKLLNDEPKEDVLAAVEAVKQGYEARPGLHLAEVAGGYQITTRPELHDWVRRLFHERTTQKLSVASLETLSVIAYKQPITQAEIGEIRGVNTSGVLSTLLERHLIKIVGRKNVIGRPFLYGTTREFLIRFGLKDVSDLPRIEDMAQQLGFEPPAVLMEQNVPEDMLPLEEEPGQYDVAGEMSASGSAESRQDVEPTEVEDSEKEKHSEKDEEPSQEG